MKEDEKIKITKCTGEGLGTCKRCYETKGYNRIWMTMLWKIEGDGLNGYYCSSCKNKIFDECQKRGETK